MMTTAAACLMLTGCSDSGDADPALTSPPPSAPSTTSVPADDRFPDVVSVEPGFDGDTWQFAVTISSPYDTPERYADGWRVIGPDGTAYGEHTLTHDHANEQPFTRTQSGVEIPAEVDEVTIEGRDLANGYGGGTVVVDLSPWREEEAAADG